MNADNSDSSTTPNFTQDDLSHAAQGETTRSLPLLIRFKEKS